MSEEENVSGRERPVYNPVQFSKTLLEVRARASKIRVKEQGKVIVKESSYEDYLDEDGTKSYLTDQQLKTVLTHANLANYIKSAGNRLGYDLSRFQNFVVMQKKQILIYTRSKNGFMAILTKTERQVTEQFLENVQKQLAMEEKKARPWYRKIV